MQVHIHKTRQQRFAAQIDHLITGQITAVGDDGSDALPIGQHRVLGEGLHIRGAVQDHTVGIGVFHDKSFLSR